MDWRIACGKWSVIRRPLRAMGINMLGHFPSPQVRYWIRLLQPAIPQKEFWYSVYMSMRATHPDVNKCIRNKGSNTNQRALLSGLFLLQLLVNQDIQEQLAPWNSLMLIQFLLPCSNVISHPFFTFLATVAASIFDVSYYHAALKSTIKYFPSVLLFLPSQKWSKLNWQWEQKQSTVL